MKQHMQIYQILLVISAFLVPSFALAQTASTEMTIEELEQFIQQQQQALDEVKLQRDQHQEKRRQVAEALVEREAELEKIEAELEALCKEQKELDPNAACES